MDDVAPYVLKYCNASIVLVSRKCNSQCKAVYFNNSLLLVNQLDIGFTTGHQTTSQFLNNHFFVGTNNHRITIWPLSFQPNTPEISPKTIIIIPHSKASILVHMYIYCWQNSQAEKELIAGWILEGDHLAIVKGNEWCLGCASRYLISEPS